MMLQLLAWILIFCPGIHSVDICFSFKKETSGAHKLAKTLLEVSSVGAKQQTQHKLLSAGLNFCQHLVTRWVHRLEGDATLTVCLRYVKSCQHDSAERALAPAPESSPAGLLGELAETVFAAEPDSSVTELGKVSRRFPKRF